MRVLLDTDVTLDFVLQRQPFFIEADEIFLRCTNGEFEAYVCDITPINVFYIARREMEHSKVLQAISDLIKTIKICTAERFILQNALTSPIMDYEDAVQHECARSENLDAIVTRNVKDYKNASVEIYSPNEFLKQI